MQPGLELIVMEAGEEEVRTQNWELEQRRSLALMEAC